MQVYSVSIYRNGTLVKAWLTDPMDEQRADEYMAAMEQAHPEEEVCMAEPKHQDDFWS